MVGKASFRYAMGHFASGVTIMTTAGREGFHGMTVSAFASVSLDPLLILACVERSTLMHRLLGETGTFALNVLPCGRQSRKLAHYYGSDNSCRLWRSRASS